MSRNLLLRLSAFFALFTFAGHTVGAISGPPADQLTVMSVYSMMKLTTVSLPMGAQRSIATMMLGANLCLSVYLLVSGLLFILLSMPKEKPSSQDNRILLLNSFGMLMAAVISVFCFFPLPALCTGLAGILGLVAIRKA